MNDTLIPYYIVILILGVLLIITLIIYFNRYIIFIRRIEFMNGWRRYWSRNIVDIDTETVATTIFDDIETVASTVIDDNEILDNISINNEVKDIEDNIRIAEII